MNGLYALLATAGIVWMCALIEAWRYRRLLQKIPHRIHVNGTRGKSSVARLIAAGLRAGGIRTCAKTTGTLARMIFPDGRELPIFRPDRANVIEQKRIVKTAVAQQAEALVIECMALQPLLQSVCELKLVRSTIGVITNARADHLDVMGPTRLDVARALSATTPVNGTLLTAEDRGDSLQVMSDACRDRGSRLQCVTPADATEITQDELSQFSYLEHAENVALALAVCQQLGVERHLALRGMWEAEPDPGAMRVHQREVDAQPWRFVNAFAANDPESTSRIWQAAYDYFPGITQRILVMNCRVDRIDRSTTMADACVQWFASEHRPDRVVIIGSGTDHFLRRLLRGGVPADRILCLGNATPEELVAVLQESLAPTVNESRELVAAATTQLEAWEQTASQAIRLDHHHESSPTGIRPRNETNDSVLLMGIGNIAGPGMRLADSFAQVHSQNPCSKSTLARDPHVHLEALSWEIS